VAVDTPIFFAIIWDTFPFPHLVQGTAISLLGAVVCLV